MRGSRHVTLGAQAQPERHLGRACKQLHDTPACDIPGQRLHDGQGIRQRLAAPGGGTQTEVMRLAVAASQHGPGCSLDRQELAVATCIMVTLQQQQQQPQLLLYTMSAKGRCVTHIQAWAQMLLVFAAM